MKVKVKTFEADVWEAIHLKAISKMGGKLPIEIRGVIRGKMSNMTTEDVRAAILRTIMGE